MGLQSLSSRAIMGHFYLQLEQGDGGWVNNVSFPVESNQPGEDYAWLGSSPTMREWVGGRQAKGLRENLYSIRNKPWEATLEVSVDDIRRDKTGQIEVRINELAQRANAHWTRLASGLIIAGASTPCYDGQFFFDVDHQEGDSGVQSNDIDVDLSDIPVAHHGTVAAPSAGEMAAVILRGIQQLYGFKDDQGEPMNELAKSFLVQVPTHYWTPALAAVTNANIDSGDTNTLASSINGNGLSIEVVMNPRLNWTDRIVILRRDGNVKPFIRQEEVPVEMSAVAEGSQLEFTDRKHWYGLYASGNMGYGYWQHAVRVRLVA